MLWHNTQGKDDTIMNGPADSKAWKEITKIYNCLQDDPRMIHFGISMDGVNPWGFKI
jgi:hypothetical protein